MSHPTINWCPDDLRNELVQLVPLQPEHFEDLFKVASDPLIWEQHPASDRYRREVFKDFFDAAIEGRTAFLILDAKTGAIVGSTRYYDFSSSVSIAIGYTFMARNYWGGLFNSSVKQLLLTYAFRFVNEVYFHIGATNIRSQKGTMKLGARKVGEKFKEVLGRRELSFEYVIRKSDYLPSTTGH
jgi:RimJ/RimL family protein N-acetyltransferase